MAGLFRKRADVSRGDVSSKYEKGGGFYTYKIGKVCAHHL